MIRQVLLLAVFLSITASSCFGQFRSYNKLEGRNIGKVDTMIYTQFTISKNDPDQTRRLDWKTVSVFNRKGYMTEDLYYIAPNKMDTGAVDTRPLRIVHSYNEKGNAAETVYYHANGVPYSKEIYAFDRSASLIEIKKYDLPDKIFILTTKMLLDKKGNILM